MQHNTDCHLVTALLQVLLVGRNLPAL